MHNIIILSSVSLSNTPVLKNTISYLEGRSSVIFIEYQSKKRVKFIVSAIREIIKKGNSKTLIFVGIQSLPLLFIFQNKKCQKYYWALESYKVKLLSLDVVNKINIVQYLIRWDNIYLIVPSAYRLSFFNKFKYKKHYIIENTNLSGNRFSKRSLNEGKLKLVMYGRLSNIDVYLEEFIIFAKNNQNDIELHLIGWDFLLGEEIKDTSNIFYHGPLDHTSLMEMINNFHFSVVGYRPYKFNNKYCAPNKLFESMSLSLPIIANKKNPPLVDIINETNSGVLFDFDNINIDYQRHRIEMRKEYSSFNRNSYSAYVKKYHLENYVKSVFE